MLGTLYEQDFYLWLTRTADIIRMGKWEDLDLINLAEEIEAMGRSEKRALKSNLVIILQHLLKYRYQPDMRSKSWRVTLIEHRQRIEKLLIESPSLRGYLDGVLDECYEDAVRLASAETDISILAFPSTSPFTLDQVRDTDYLPH